jgi:hypothetical protein
MRVVHTLRTCKYLEPFSWFVWTLFGPCLDTLLYQPLSDSYWLNICLDCVQ